MKLASPIASVTATAACFRSGVLLALFLVLAPVVSGAAEPSSVDAQRLYLAGRQAFAAARLDVAASSFEAAYRIDPRPGLLWNLGQTYRRQFLLDEQPQQLRRAVDAYRRYLTESPLGPNHEEAERLLAELSPILLRLEPPTPAELVSSTPTARPPKTELLIVADAENARARIDGAAAADAPLLVEVSAGRHRAEVSAPGYFPFPMSVVAVDGRLVTAEARLSAKPALVDVRGPRGARLFVDRQPMGTLPRLPLELAGGSHELTLLARGRESWTRTLSLGRGASTTVNGTPNKTLQRRAAPVLAVLGAGTAAVSIVLVGLWAQADASAAALYRQDLTSHLTPQQLSDYLGDRSARDQLRIATAILLGVSGALELSAGALYLFDQPSLPERAP